MTVERLPAAEAFSAALAAGGRGRLFWWHRDIIEYVEESAENGVFLTAEQLQHNSRWIVGTPTPGAVEQLLTYRGLVEGLDGFIHLPEPSVDQR